MTLKLSGLVKKAHYLSLDIVLGALAISVLSARMFKALPGWAWWVALALSVWILYTGDRLLVAFRNRKNIRGEMHAFLLGNRRTLLYGLLVVAAADVMIILNFLGRDTMIAGLILAGSGLIFYATRHLFLKKKEGSIPGELFVLIFYVAATWLGPLLTRRVELIPEHGLILAMTCGILLMNLGIISLYDTQRYTRLGIPTLARSIGTVPTRNLIVATGLLVLILGMLQFMVYGIGRISQLALILMGMTSILMLVVLLPSYFRREERYRITSDAVLMLGFLSLLVGN